MLRAVLVALALSTLLLWVVGVVDDATTWMTWVDGVVAVLTLLLVPITRERVGPVAVSTGPALLGVCLLAVFVIGLATRASAWLTWFTFVFGCGYLSLAGFAFLVRATEPRMESRRPSSML